MQPKPMTLGDAATGADTGRGTARTVKGLAVSYVRLCRGMGRPLTSTLEPRPGDWLLREDGELELATDPPRALQPGEIVVPRLERLVELIHAEAPSVVIDAYSSDFACLAFDGDGRSLANIVSRNIEEAVMRALLFIQSERAANETRG